MVTTMVCPISMVTKKIWKIHAMITTKSITSITLMKAVRKTTVTVTTPLHPTLVTIILLIKICLNKKNVNVIWKTTIILLVMVSMSPTNFKVVIIIMIKTMV
jgi:hypothetical protein